MKQPFLNAVGAFDDVLSGFILQVKFSLGVVENI